MNNEIELQSQTPADDPIVKNKKDMNIKGKIKKWRKILLPTILFFIILPVSIFALSQEKNKRAVGIDPNANSPIILYYSYQCPHCKNLEKWIEENDIQQKVQFARKEVGKSQQNASELVDRARACNIPDDEIGVPFLWDGNAQKCIMGDSEITAYFQGKLSSGTTAATSETPQQYKANAK